MSSTDNFDDAGLVLLLGTAKSPTKSPARTRPAPTPLRTSLWTVYATTLVLLLLMPHAAVNWLDDMPPSPLVTLARTCLRPVALVSDGLGLGRLYDATRRQTEALSKRAE